MRIAQEKSLASFPCGPLWLLFSLFILYATLIPFRFDLPLAPRLETVHWLPFVDLHGRRASLPDMVQNVLLFMPFGMFGYSFCAGPPLSRLLRVAMLGMLLSLLVETLQLFTVDRTTSATDVATNTLGALLGALLVLFVARQLLALYALPWIRSWVGTRFFYPLLVAITVAAVANLQPFDFSLDVGIVGGKLKSFIHNPWGFQWPLQGEGEVVLRYALLAWSAFLFFQARGLKYPILGSILLGVSIGFALEAAQFIVASRMPSGWDLVVAVFGAVLGGGCARICYRKVPAPVLFWALAVATLAAAAMEMMTPFRFQQGYCSMNLLPFIAHYSGSFFSVFANFTGLVLLYFPLGFCFGGIFGRKAKVFNLLLPVVLTALALEILQGFVPGRYPDITDVIASAMGAWAGFRTALLWPQAISSEIRRS